MTPRAHMRSEDRITALQERARRMAARLAPLRSTRTPAIERADLRLLGVHGLDPRGRPLAAAVVELLRNGGRGGGRGDDSDDPVGLLLAAAAVDGPGPQEAALAIAAGAIGMDEITTRLAGDRRRAAEELHARWLAEAYERIDANRTARLELSDGLGMSGEPWLGARLSSFDFADAIGEARAFVDAGADVLIVRTPPSREFAGLAGERQAAGEAGRRGAPTDMDPPPAGSQRGLAAMRALVDESAAQRSAYVSLATVGEGLAAPEQALVAGFERVDMLFLDPFEETAQGIAWERALADHAAAHRLVARSGTFLVLGPGPLLAGGELARGESIDARTRIGRSIAAQAAAVAWARGSGLSPGQLMIEAPFEFPASTDDAGLVMAEVAARRLLHGDLGMVISEPADGTLEMWRLCLPLCLLAGRTVRLVVPRAEPSELAGRASDVHAAAALAETLAELLGSRPRPGWLPLSAAAEATIGELVDIADETLAIVEDQGWAALIGGP